MENKSAFVPESKIMIDVVQKDPDKIRFMLADGAGGWRGVTWGEYYLLSGRIAHFLLHLGVGAGTKVALYAKNLVQWAYCDMALKACRAVYVPVYLSSTAEQARYVLIHSDAEVVVTDRDRLPVLLHLWDELPLVKKIIVMDPDFTREELDLQTETFCSATGKSLSRDAVALRVLPLSQVYERGEELRGKDPDCFLRQVGQVRLEDVSTIIYTSGTTGNPKGVVLTIHNLLTNAMDWIKVLSPLIPQERVDLLWLPLSHIFGWGEMGLGNVLGFTTYMASPLEVLSLMPQVRPTLFISVPAYWEKLAFEAQAGGGQRDSHYRRLHELTGGRLQFCLSGGAGLKREVKEFFYGAGLLIIEGYGLTECSPTLTMNRKDDFDFDTVGKPFPTVELKLAPDGEVLAKGPNVFREYYKDPVNTRESFDEEGWFKTGDLGEFTKQGFLKIKGRKKELIVTSGGKNIAPLPIEMRFKDDPIIEHIVLYGNERKYLVALVTVRLEVALAAAHHAGVSFKDEKELLAGSFIAGLVSASVERINSELASFETIKKFHIHQGRLTVEQGFLTPSFKLRRKAVYDAFSDVLDTLYDDEKDKKR